MGRKRLRSEREQTKLILYKFELHNTAVCFTVHLTTDTNMWQVLAVLDRVYFTKLSPLFSLFFISLQIILERNAYNDLFLMGRSALLSTELISGNDVCLD